MGQARPRLSCHNTLQAVAPLMKYLDEKLALLSASLVKENLSRYQLSGWGGQGRQGGSKWTVSTLYPCRVLEALWELLLQAILQALGTNSDVSADFYGRFHFTLEVGLLGAHQDPLYLAAC